MQLTPPCLGPACWWTTQESGLLLRWQLQLGAHSVGFLFLFFFFSWLCCPLRFQNSPKTCLWEGFLLFGNFSFMTPSPGQISVPKSFVCFCILYFVLATFIFCPTYFQREWAAFLGVWWPLPTFRSCFVEVAQHSNDLLMHLWGRKWSPHPIPLPSWGCPPYVLLIMFAPVDLWRWKR